MTPEDWERVYREHFPALYRALVATLLDRDAALDALHEAFAAGLHKPPPDERNLAGWIYRVALRKAKAPRRGTVPLRADVAADDQTPVTLDRLEAGQLLMLLTERQRAIVLSHYWLGMTQEEIAEVFGIRRGSVGATIAQALARMRKEPRPNVG